MDNNIYKAPYQKAQKSIKNAKRTHDPSDWNKFKQIRNKVQQPFVTLKKAQNDHLADKSSDLSSKQCGQSFKHLSHQSLTPQSLHLRKMVLYTLVTLKKLIF